MTTQSEWQTLANELETDTANLGYRTLDDDYDGITSLMKSVEYGDNPEPQGEVEQTNQASPSAIEMADTMTMAEWLHLTSLSLQASLDDGEAATANLVAELKAVQLYVINNGIDVAASAWDFMKVLSIGGVLNDYLTILFRGGNITQVSAVAIDALITSDTVMVPDPNWSSQIVVRNSQANLIGWGNVKPADIQRVLTHPDFGVWP